jgi:hypothetical protein
MKSYQVKDLGNTFRPAAFLFADILLTFPYRIDCCVVDSNRQRTRLLLRRIWIRTEPNRTRTNNGNSPCSDGRAAERETRRSNLGRIIREASRSGVSVASTLHCDVIPHSPKQIHLFLREPCHVSFSGSTADSVRIVDKTANLQCSAYVHGGNSTNLGWSLRALTIFQHKHCTPKVEKRLEGLKRYIWERFGLWKAMFDHCNETRAYVVPRHPLLLVPNPQHTS